VFDRGGANVVIRYSRWIHLIAAWLTAASVLLQAYLAGAALAQLGGNGDFSTHISLGYSLPGLLSLITLIAALVGRAPRQQVGLSILLFVDYFVQTSLPEARGSAPAIAALHPANALLMFILACFIGWRARPLVAAASKA
jgi:hypothetical protein